MPIIEKLGSFFLGREYDLKTRQAAADKPVNYDARDLTTHAIVVGMTGSTNYPRELAHQTTYGGSQYDGFLSVMY